MNVLAGPQLGFDGLHGIGLCRGEISIQCIVEVLHIVLTVVIEVLARGGVSTVTSRSRSDRLIKEVVLETSTQVCCAEFVIDGVVLDNRQFFGEGTRLTCLPKDFLDRSVSRALRLAHFDEQVTCRGLFVNKPIILASINVRLSSCPVCHFKEGHGTIVLTLSAEGYATLISIRGARLHACWALPILASLRFVSHFKASGTSLSAQNFVLTREYLGQVRASIRQESIVADGLPSGFANITLTPVKVNPCRHTPV